MPQRLTKSSIYSRSLHLLDLQLVLLWREQKQVCLLCEGILKQIPAFNSFCASLETISAIENVLGMGRRYGRTSKLYLGFGAGKMAFWEVCLDVDTTVVEVIAAREADVGVEVGIGSDREDEAGGRSLGIEGRRMLAASEQRVSMLDRIGVLERDNMRLRGMLCVERERVDSLQRHMSYTQEELRQMRVSCYYDRAEFKRLETFAMRRLGYRP
ncbi:hypothetical protein Tco_0635041 [Tanacetum coccineum]